MPIAIYKPKVIPKKVPSRQCHEEHGGEIIYLLDDDIGQEEDPNYFQVKLGYNGVHHYVPIVPSSIVTYLEVQGHVKYYTKGCRDSLKLLLGHLPKQSNYYKLVSCAHEALLSTTTVLSGCNIITGATGTAGAATAADAFRFPVPESLPSGKRRKVAVPAGPSQILHDESSGIVPSQSTRQEEEEQDEPQLVYQAYEKDDSPQVTIQKHKELKHAKDQCFCGKSGLKTQDDKDKHFKQAHFQKGHGINPKTGKKNDLWACHSCQKSCKDNRAVWKHFRTQHLNMFIHYCPVDGCNEGNDQKDSMVSHILKNHKQEVELVEKCYMQKWLKCIHCDKFFLSVKGKNSHEATCLKPKIKINCPFEHCFKTYTSEEGLDAHIQTAHHGKAHQCLCPHCGQPFTSKQNLDRHIQKEHTQE